MTRLRLSDKPEAGEGARLLAVPVFAGENGVVEALASDLPALLPPAALAALRRDRSFSGKLGELALLPASHGTGADLLAIGLGPAGHFGLDALRVAAQLAAVRGALCTSLTRLGEDRAGAVRAVAEGIGLGHYRAPGAPGPEEGEDLLLLRAGESADPALERALVIGEVAARTANWVRHLVDLPPNQLTPERFAGLVAEKANELGLGVEVWDGEAIEARGFGATAAVGAGSARTPRVAVLRGPVRSDRKPLGLAGKGITFDAGGLNLKRNASEIVQMKNDMAGAAAVAGAVFAAVELGIMPDVVAVLPMAENLPGGAALRPGDVVGHPNGMRSEVVDTDCEGRLVLADAIAFLTAAGVDGIVDVGTLTDGGGVGPLLWGCWANDDRLAASVLAAGQRAGEPGWRLPLRAEYRGALDSRVADIANTALSQPDIGLTAATYLSAFAAATPWVHIDNGSSATIEHPIGPWSVGPTASPMRALLQLLLERG
ncbi:leucyl aminopeptidase family protein [Labrys neptuniae]